MYEVVIIYHGGEGTERSKNARYPEESIEGIYPTKEAAEKRSKEYNELATSSETIVRKQKED